LRTAKYLETSDLLLKKQKNGTLLRIYEGAFLPGRAASARHRPGSIAWQGSQLSEGTLKKSDATARGHSLFEF
jgi:hypothetical protein